MKNNKPLDISFFDKYLTVWVALCMVCGVLVLLGGLWLLYTAR